jgi:hypothetical protein
MRGLRLGARRVSSGSKTDDVAAAINQATEAPKHGRRGMNGEPTIWELEERIAVIRQNIAELVEQGCGFLGCRRCASISVELVSRQGVDQWKILPMEFDTYSI